jgi:hypothetical protein
MINPRRQNQQVILLQPNPNPLIPFTPNIKKPIPIQNIPNLFIFMQMLRKERFDLLFVHGAHLVGRNGDFVPIFVAAFGCQGVDGGELWETAVDYAEGLEVGFCDGAAGVVVFALVALLTVSPLFWKGRGL